MTTKVCFLLIIVTITISVTTAAFIFPDDWLEEDNTFELDDTLNPYVKRAMEMEYNVEKRAGYGPCRDYITQKICKTCDRRYKKNDPLRYRLCRTNTFVKYDRRY